jgi:hypothetical protein
VWARPFACLDYREFPLRGDRLQVPADCAGWYVVKVTPEVQPWQHLAATAYQVRTLVEIRQPGTTGSATVLTRDNRRDFGRGEAIPFTVVVRGQKEDELALTVNLTDGKRTLARGRARVKRGARPVAFNLPATLTAGLRPGRYALSVSARGLTCTSQPLVLGPGQVPTPFHFLHYADYKFCFPSATVWEAPDLVTAHGARLRKLGVNLLVDRLGLGEGLGTLVWDRNSKAELDELVKSLGARGGAVAPEKMRMASPLLQTQAVYSAAGIEQMAILMSMDAGLPLGTGFDRRSPKDFERDITRVTRALLPYPSFRGWSWAANWWNFDKRGAKGARTAKEEAAYLAALKRANETGAWDRWTCNTRPSRSSRLTPPRTTWTSRNGPASAPGDTPSWATTPAPGTRSCPLCSRWPCAGRTGSAPPACCRTGARSRKTRGPRTTEPPRSSGPWARCSSSTGRG